MLASWEEGEVKLGIKVFPGDTANIPGVLNMKWDLTGKRRGKVEGDPLFMKATEVQHSLHRPMQRWIRLLQKQGLVMVCQSSASWVQKAERH